MKYLFSIIIGLTASVSLADTYSSIEKLSLDNNQGGQVFIKLKTPPTGQAACQSSNDWHYVVSIGTEAQQFTFKSLMMAKMNGQEISLVGAGNCALVADIETLASLKLNAE